MFDSHHSVSFEFWHWVTRLGEAQLVVPLAVLTAVSRAWGAERISAALRLTTALVLAVLLTTASKVAFIGWGIGSAELDFTGISGHTMFAAAVYPLLFPTIASGGSRRSYWVAIAIGVAIAFLVGVSRFVLGAHSPSEIAAGWLVGGLVSGLVLATETSVRTRLRAALVVTAVLWMALLPAAGSVLDTHYLVTRLALKLSGHVRPYTRGSMLRAAHEAAHPGDAKPS